jgi:hypothetical protein
MGSLSTLICIYVKNEQLDYVHSLSIQVCRSKSLLQKKCLIVEWPWHCHLQSSKGLERVDRVGPLGLYSFLIVREITNIMVKQVSADLKALHTFMCRFYECPKAQLTNNFGI